MNILSMSREELAERVRLGAGSRKPESVAQKLSDGDHGIAFEKAQIIQLKPFVTQYSMPTDSDVDFGVTLEPAQTIQLISSSAEFSGPSKSDGEARSAVEQAQIVQLEPSVTDVTASVGKVEELLNEREPMLEMCINTLSSQIVDLQNKLKATERFSREQLHILLQERQKSAELMAQVRALRIKVRSLQQVRDVESPEPWWRSLVPVR